MAVKVQPPPSAGSGQVGWGAVLATNDVGGFGTMGAQDKSGVYDPTTNQTFVFYYGYDFWLTAKAFDHATRRWSASVRISAPPAGTEYDAHGIPSVVIDDQGTIHGFYGPHDTPPVYFKSNAPRSINGGFTVTTLAVGTGTYHQLVWEPTTSALYAVFRSGSGHGTGYPHHEYGGFMRSLDRGATWTEISTASVGFVDLTGYSADSAKDFYVMGAETDGTGNIFFVWTISHGVTHDTYREDIYCAVYKVSDGHFYTVAGVDRGTTIAGSGALAACKAVTAGRSPLHRLLLVSGKPVIVYPTRALGAASITGVLNDTFSNEVDGTNLTAHISDIGTRWAKAPFLPDNMLVSAAGEVYAPGNVFPLYVSSRSLGPDQSTRLNLNVITSGAGQVAAYLRSGLTDVPAGDGTKYGAFYDATTGILSMARYNSAGSGVAIGGTVNVGALSVGAHYLDFSAIGSTLTASIDGGTALVVTDSTITTSGSVSIRVRNSDLTTGIHITSVTATGTPIVGSTQVVRWTGSAWATSDTGARHHNMFEFPGIYQDSKDGSLVVLAPTGRTDEPLSNHPVSDDAIIYSKIGGDISAYRSRDGGATWTNEGQVLDRRNVRGQGITGVTVPRNVHSGMRALALTSSMTPYIGANGSGANRINGRLALYMIDDGMDPVSSHFDDATPIDQHIEVVTVRPSGLPLPAVNIWESLNLAAYIPENVTKILLRFSVTGTGTIGPQGIRVRRKGTNYTNGEWDFTFRGEITDARVEYAWVPIDRDGLLEWQRTTPSTQVATVAIGIAGFRTG